MSKTTDPAVSHASSTLGSVETSTTEHTVKMTNKSKRPTTYNERIFLQLFFAMQAMGTLMIAITIIWIVSFYGGFSWTNIKLRFNFHPIMMIFGMVYLSGNSLLAFRVLKNQPKPLVKIVHAAIHVTAFFTALIGAIAVWTNHTEQNLANLYSLHSWIGGSCLTLFFVQYLGGFFAYLYPVTSGAFRAALLPYHVLGGLGIFGLAVMASLTGFAEKMGFDVGNYANFSGRMWWMNFGGFCIIIFAFLVFYLATERSYKRHVVGEQLPLTQDFRSPADSNVSSPNN